MITVERAAKGYYHAIEEGEKICTLSNGNSKILGLCFSNKPGSKGSCNRDCEKCYARKNYVDKAPAVKAMRERNFLATKRDDFADILISMYRRALKDLSPRYSRINDAGDFSDGDNFIDWNIAAQCLPEVKFLAYTKRLDILNTYSRINLPSNFKLFVSIMPDMKALEQLLAVNVSSKLNLPLAFVGSPEEYSLVAKQEIEQRMENYGSIICNYDNCAVCQRKCWELNLDRNNAVKFFWH